MPRSEVEAQPAVSLSPSRRAQWLRRIGNVAVILLLIRFALAPLSRAGSFLVINAPERSDVMVVLAGGAGSSRFAQALRLQKKGYAPRVLVDADVTRNYYGKSEADMVLDYLHRTNQTEVKLCPTMADSTYAEAVDVKKCMERAKAASGIIVTSDFHTRRALSIFRKRLPQYEWSVAASSAPANAAEQYWKHRWWAKTVIDEWEKYLWWELVDRWRADAVLK
jgi:uncharacterized SAM-binding protein YcdF (DUF218 family)